MMRNATALEGGGYARGHSSEFFFPSRSGECSRSLSAVTVVTARPARNREGKYATPTGMVLEATVFEDDWNDPHARR